jgi:hypothetical protein
MAGFYNEFTDNGEDIQLTTNGNSGPATLNGGVLNIPVYSGGGVFTALTITGTVDNSNLVFTLSFAPNPSSTLMLFDGTQYQIQGLDYSLSGNNVTFNAGHAPSVVLTGFALQ